jgi:hypothetical protein
MVSVYLTPSTSLDDENVSLLAFANRLSSRNNKIGRSGYPDTLSIPHNLATQDNRAETIALPDSCAFPTAFGGWRCSGGEVILEASGPG